MFEHASRAFWRRKDVFWSSVKKRPTSTEVAHTTPSARRLRNFCWCQCSVLALSGWSPVVTLLSCPSSSLQGLCARARPLKQQAAIRRVSRRMLENPSTKTPLRHLCTTGIFFVNHKQQCGRGVKLPIRGFRIHVATNVTRRVTGGFHGHFSLTCLRWASQALGVGGNLKEKAKIREEDCGRGSCECDLGHIGICRRACRRCSEPTPVAKERTRK